MLFFKLFVVIILEILSSKSIIQSVFYNVRLDNEISLTVN